MRRQKKYAAIVLFFLMFIVAGFGIFQPGSQALTLFKKLSKKTTVVPFKARFQAFQDAMPEDRVYLSCDKPFYYPGETVWFEAYVRNAADMKPSLKSEIVHVEWIAPSGNVVKELHLIARNGTAAGDVNLPESMPGGIYTLKAFTSWQKNSPEPAFFVKDVPVQNVILPAVKMKLDFLKESYGPGDEVLVKFDVAARDDKPLQDQTYTCGVLLSGKRHKEIKGKTRKDGSALIRFTLPENLDSADGVLSVTLPYEGKTESIARSIPILATRLDVGIYPEGGDLVTGIESRVAVRVRDEFGKPADVSAVVETSDGKRVTEFDTVHQGMGLFKLKPSISTGYVIRIVKPKGVSGQFPLPSSLERGYVLEASVREGKEAVVLVKSTEKEMMTVTVRSRGKHYDERSFMAGQGENRLSFDLSSFPMGVAQITLFDSKNIERAERLCFIHPKKQLKISLSTDKKVYGPREKVTLTVKTTDDRGLPVPAQFTVSVADDNLLTFADDKQGHILSKLLLEPDLTGDVFEPSFYFDEKEKKRDEAMDLLMMTQGWRRFTWKAVLAETPPTLSFPGERAEIKGTVLMGTGRPEPAAGAKVTVESSGKSVIADEKGQFIIRDLDLYKTESLVASKGAQTGFPVSVSRYDTPLTVYLSPRIFERMDLKGRAKGMDVPMAVGAVPEALNAFTAEDEGAGKMAMMAVPPPMPAPVMAKPVEQDNEPARRVAMEIMDPRFMGKIRRDVIPVDDGQAPVYTRARVFPETVYETTETDTRSDFRSTLYFKGLVETDRRGVARLTFCNSDAVTSFRAVAEGISADGLVGRADHAYSTALPFSLDVKIPVSVSMGDEVSLPLTLSNGTGKTLAGSLDITVPQGFKSLGPLNLDLSVEKGQAKTLLVPFVVADMPGKTTFKATFSSGKDSDTVVKDITVAPRGFPVSIGLSAQEKDKTFDVTVEKPVPGSLVARFSAYPTVASELVKGIESILQEPYGCFEQASSSTYPNILVLDYLKEQKDPDPSLMKKACDLIGKGYERLVAYETQEKGYEWFGEKPGHEALTAYGLMEFRDMAMVYPGVDAAMVKRTGDWLLSRRDGQGGFARNAKALDSFGRADAAVTNAYIVYALSEAGYVFEIKAELDKAVETAVKTKDPYQLALMANALFNVKDPRKEEILKQLLTLRKDDGSYIGLSTSVTCSTGASLTVETTALAVLAQLKSTAPDARSLETSVRFLVSARSAYGGFGNTQSTVLALKALTNFARFSRRTAESGRIVVFVDDRPVSSVSYAKGETQEVTLPERELSGCFKEGSSRVRVLFEGVTQALPYTFSLTYNTYQPASSGVCPLKFETKLDTQEVNVGNPLRMTVTLTNTVKDKGQPMSLAVIGIPGGLSPLPWQIKELQDKKIVDYVEILGNNLVLYYRQMKPGETKTVLLDLKAEVPGIYEGAASSAYLYYSPENKVWVKGAQVKIHE